MPPLPPAGQVLRIGLQFTGESKTFGSRFFISYSGGTPTAADCGAIATEVSTAWGSDFASLLSNNYALTAVSVEDLSSASGATGEWSGNVAGTRSGTNVPMNMTVTVDFTLARRYRGGKPKIFLPLGIAADQQSETSWTSALATSSGTAWSNFVNAIIATSGVSVSLGQHVNVSYYSGFTVVTSPTTGRSRNVPKLRSSPLVADITGHTGRTQMGTQRRRLRLKS